MSCKKQSRLSAADIRDLASGHGACVASDHITVGGQPVGFMYRMSPETEVDSGWVFMSGQESQAYMDDPDHLALYDVNTVAHYDPSIIPLLDAPYGSVFEKRCGSFVIVTDWSPHEH